MSTDERFFPDPEEASNDGSLARVFLLALVLLVGLTMIFFLSGLGQALGEAVRSSIGSSRPVPIFEYSSSVPPTSFLSFEVVGSVLGGV